MRSRVRRQGLWLAALLAACAPAASTPEIDWSYETAVRSDTPAGDHQGVTGTVERLALASDLVAPRDIEVWLPPGYHASDARFPVLYMHDGQNVFDPAQSGYSGWDWGVDEALTALDIPAIVVAVHSVDATRNADYFPQAAGLDHGRAFRNAFGLEESELNADSYLRYLVEVVKPEVDRRYRTQPDRASTSVMGSSMGGLISLYAVSRFPDVFGGAAMVSTHLPEGDGALVDWFAANLPDPAAHRLYFDYGTKTLDHNYEPFQTRLDAAVEAAGYTRGVNWTTRKFEGDDHSERAWRNRVHVPLQFLLQGRSVAGGMER